MKQPRQQLFVELSPELTPTKCVESSKWQEIKNPTLWDFAGGPVVKTTHFTAGAMGSIPGWVTKIPQVKLR